MPTNDGGYLSVRRGDKASGRLLRRAVIAITAIFAVALTGWASFRGYLIIPYSDPHDWLALALRSGKSAAALRSLWTPHGNQRVPLVRLLSLLYVWTFAGRFPIFFAAACASWAWGIVCLFYHYRKSVDLEPALLAAASVLILCNSGICEGLGWPVFSVYPMVVGFSVASLALASVQSESNVIFALSILSAFLGSCGNAAGLAVWPCLTVLSIVQRRSVRRTMILMALFLVITATFEMNLSLPSGSVGLTQSINIPKVLTYFAAFAALPWSGGGVATLPLVFVGATVETLVVSLIAQGLLIPKSRGRLYELGVGLALFGLLTAALAALGRVNELPQVVIPTRYFAFAATLQLALLSLLAGPVLAFERRRPRISTLVVIAVCAMLIRFEWRDARSFVRTSDAILRASQAFDAGDRSAATVGMVYPNPQRAKEIRDELARSGLPH